MTRPPPPPTLFPYTTLFRSLPRHRRGVREQGPRLPGLCLRRGGHDRDRGAGEVDGGPFREPHDHRDRKSTRLNSSHMSISYAVFCLKKKNNQITFIW